jgi:outer membrane protein assembly factor BamC
MLSKALKTKYGLPIADKYRIRVEESASKKSSEIYLTLTSIEEVVNGGMRVWQARAKDVELETEMLLRLMVFLGSDRSEAIEKITNSLEVDKPQVMVNKAENGYAELIFPFDQRQTWDYLGWALDELDVDIEDLDVTEGSYYVNIVTNKGLFARLMPSSIQRKTYQLFVKELDKANSIVVFNDLSEENEQDTIDFSFDLFNEIAAKF